MVIFSPSVFFIYLTLRLNFRLSGFYLFRYLDSAYWTSLILSPQYFFPELQCAATERAKKLTSSQLQRVGSYTHNLRARVPSFGQSFEQRDCSGFFLWPASTLMTARPSSLSGIRKINFHFLCKFYSERHLLSIQGGRGHINERTYV